MPYALIYHISLSGTTYGVVIAGEVDWLPNGWCVDSWHASYEGAMEASRVSVSA